eukprot:scaffold18474_cov22-Tisochrysis_lutea.AAC.1
MFSYKEPFAPNPPRGLRQLQRCTGPAPASPDLSVCCVGVGAAAAATPAAAAVVLRVGGSTKEGVGKTGAWCASRVEGTRAMRACGWRAPQATKRFSTSTCKQDCPFKTVVGRACMTVFAA